MENTNSNNNIVRNWLSGIGVALLAIVAITFAIHRKETLSSIAANTSTTTELAAAAALRPEVSIKSPTLITTSSMGEMVSVMDQSAGASVAINTMTLARKSWVAIKDTKGMILGAGLFPANTTSGSVSLLRNTVAGARYAVVVYVDDGDKIFNLHKDMLVSANDGSPISTAFSAK